MWSKKYTSNKQASNHSSIPPFLKGIQNLFNCITSIVPRMQWMSLQVLDKLEFNVDKLSDPLSHLPPAIKETLLQLPHIAWVTITLFIANFLAMILTVVLAEFDFINLISASLIITCLMFVMFTVSHDAAHGSISSIPIINEIVGRMAFCTMGPLVCFPTFKYIHNMHHKFTNDPIKDPDRFCIEGNWYSIPFRCMFIIPHYCYYYLRISSTRPKLEILEFIIHIGCNIGIASAAIDKGYTYQILFYWLIPSILSHGSLAFFFDFIPHHQSNATPIESRYHTTSILQTYKLLQPFLTILLQYQDYHLIHHLYPKIPFYKYSDKWHEKQDFLLKKQIIINNLTLDNIISSNSN